MMAMGDALVVAYLELNGFKDEVFARNHPGGSLGRKMLTTIEDLMHTGEQVPVVYENSDLSVIISEMTQKTTRRYFNCRQKKTTQRNYYGW